MLAYSYDNITKEFLYAFEAQINPKNLSEFLLPENCTTITCPKYGEDTIPCFLNGTWVIEKDYRNKSQINLTTLEITKIDYIGEIKKGYQLISDETIADFSINPDKYSVIDGVFTDISDTEEYKEKQKQKEKERVARLSCTKRDFVMMLEQQGIDYFETLEPMINANRQAKLEWQLCEKLYRFNPLLDQMAGALGITSEQLDIIFKTANGEEV